MTTSYIQCPACQGLRFGMGMGMMKKTECERCEGLGIIEKEDDQAKVPTDVTQASDTLPSRKKRGRPPKVLELEKA